jgi:hypothetical protein
MPTPRADLGSDEDGTAAGSEPAVCVLGGDGGESGVGPGFERVGGARWLGPQPGRELARSGPGPASGGPAGTARARRPDSRRGRRQPCAAPSGPAHGDEGARRPPPREARARQRVVRVSMPLRSTNASLAAPRRPAATAAPSGVLRGDAGATLLRGTKPPFRRGQPKRRSARHKAKGLRCRSVGVARPRWRSSSTGWPRRAPPAALPVRRRPPRRRAAAGRLARLRQRS